MDNANPIVWLCREQVSTSPYVLMQRDAYSHGVSGMLNERIKWNFTKFLIGRDGKLLKRFAPFTTPEEMEAAILAAFEI